MLKVNKYNNNIVTICVNNMLQVTPCEKHECGILITRLFSTDELSLLGSCFNNISILLSAARTVNKLR